MERSVSFSIKVTANDMYTFLLRHYFSGFGGWFGVVFGIALFVLAAVTFHKVPTQYTVLYVILGVFVLVYPFTGMRRRAKNQVASDALKDTLLYEVTTETLSVSRGEERQEFAWQEIRKVIETKKLLIVYVNTVRAFVWSKEQIGEQLPALKALLADTLSAQQNHVK